MNQEDPETLNLIRQLTLLGADNIIGQIVTDPEVAKDLYVHRIDLRGYINTPISIDTGALDELSGEIIDLILAEANALLIQKKVKEAFSRLCEGIRSVFTSLADRHLSLEPLIDRVEGIRDVGCKAATELGAQQFTIEITFSLPPALTLGLHFDTASINQEIAVR